MKNKTIDKLKVIYSSVAWGTMGLFIRLIDMPSSLVACIRGFIGAIFLYGILCIKNKSFKIDFPAIKKNLLWLSVSGIAMGLNWVLIFEAYMHTSLSIATLCYYLAPIIVIIMSCILFKESLTVKKVICIVVALIGMTFVSGVLSGNLGSGYGVSGMILALGAAVLYATVTLSGKKISGISSFDQTIFELLIAAVILIPYNLLTISESTVALSPKGIGLLILLGIIHTGGAFATYFSALHTLDAQIATIFTYLDPVVSILCSLFILREITDPFCIIGAILIIGALVMHEVLGD